MKLLEKMALLSSNHSPEWIKMYREVEDELSSKQSMFCLCGRLATGMHEMYCKRFKTKIMIETVKRLAHLI